MDENVEGDSTKEVNKVQTQLEEEAKRRKVNWNALWAEFTWEKLWATRTWGNIFGHFSKVLFLSLTPTLFDMATDALNGLNFVFGTEYQKRVKNLSDPLNENCTHVGTYLTYESDGTTRVEYEDISCHEKDTIWGYLSLGLIFLSGLPVAAGILIPHLRRAQKEKRYIASLGWFACFLFGSVFSCSVFPLFLVLVYLCALFNPGPV